MNVAWVGARIENLLALDYPDDRLEVLVASDGSTDRTDEIVREHAAVLQHGARRPNQPDLRFPW